MKCPDCGLELVDPPVWCECGQDFRHKDPRTKKLVADRPLTKSERPRLLEIRRRFTAFRWMDEEGFIRKHTHLVVGVFALFFVVGGFNLFVNEARQGRVVSAIVVFVLTLGMAGAAVESFTSYDLGTWQTHKSAGGVVAFQLLVFFPFAVPAYYWLKRNERRYLRTLKANLGEGWLAASATPPNEFSWWVQPVEYRPFAKSALGFAEAISATIVIVVLVIPLVFCVFMAMGGPLMTALMNPPRNMGPVAGTVRYSLLFAIPLVISFGVGWFPVVLSATWLARVFHSIPRLFRRVPRH